MAGSSDDPAPKNERPSDRFPPESGTRPTLDQVWGRQSRPFAPRRNSSSATTRCPICGPEADELPPTGDFHGFHCPTHDEFEVSNTAMSVRRGQEFGGGVCKGQTPKRPAPTTTNP